MTQQVIIGDLTVGYRESNPNLRSVFVRGKRIGFIYRTRHPEGWAVDTDDGILITPTAARAATYLALHRPRPGRPVPYQLQRIANGRDAGRRDR